MCNRDQENSTRKNLFISSINPATKEIIDRVTITSDEEVSSLVMKARECLPAWSNMDFKKRSLIIKNVQQLLLKKNEEIASLITQEMGRPYAEALSMEVVASVDLMGFYIRNAKKFLNSRVLPLHNLFFKRLKSHIHIEALGVLGIITPWNWPLLIPIGFITPALISGNAIIFKPSEITPLIGVQIRNLFLDAGVPEGVFQIAQGYAPAGRSLVESPVEKIFFTGSTEIGQKVMESAAKSLKDVVLELGGHDAAIVCDDADLEYCTSGVLWGSFNNCGQNCNSIERVYVSENNSGQFINLLLKKMSQLRVGNGMDPKTDIGPLATDMQLSKMVSIVYKASDQGAKILSGGHIIDSLGGYFFEPTLILWEKSLPRPQDEELFGPIMFITPVSDDQEAIRLANNSIYGLSASIWTSNVKKGQKIGQSIRSGSVMVNDSVVSFGIVEASWTGIKKSGFGWVHGERGLMEMVNMKYICSSAQFHQQKFWWFPYSIRMIESIKKGMEFLFSQKSARRLLSFPQVLRYFFGYLILNRRKKDKL